MVMFLNISINNIWNLLFLSSTITVFADILTLRYGFENHPYGYCHEFPFSASDRHILLKDSNGTKIWNYVNHADTNASTDTKVLNAFTDTNFLNASFINNSLRLCFRNLSRTDTGNYSLEEVKTDKRIYFFIDVDYEAKILSLIGKSNIEEYQEASLNCNVDSKPPANITWLLPQNGIDDPAQNEENNSKLTFANCTCEHTGEYICSASNKQDTVDTKSTFVNVTCAPKFESKHRFLDTKINLGIGDYLEYGINFTSNPRANIITDGVVNVTSYSFDAVHHILLIQKVIRDEDDIREYTIAIQNNLGVAKLVLNIMQQKIELPDMKMEWLDIGIASVSIVVLVSLSLIVVCVWKKRRKKKKRNHNDQRRKPVPTPRNNKRIMKTDLKDSLQKEVSEATIPSTSVQSDDLTFDQDEFQRYIHDCQETDICKSIKENDDGNFLQKHSKAKSTNRNGLNHCKAAKPLNYIEVESPVDRKSTVLGQSLKHRSNYYFIPNDNGVIVPLKSDDSKMCVLDDIEYQDDFTSASDPNQNMQRHQKDIEDVGICNRRLERAYGYIV